MSFVGFERYLQKVEVRSDMDLDQITLNEDAGALEEVTVTGKRPTVSRSIDLLVFNVENSILSTGNTYEILKRTPGVIESQGQLLVKNLLSGSLHQRQACISYQPGTAAVTGRLLRRKCAIY
ncbi:carboxypeptidase-like regulatory domain-containing protein [Antarcticibacterium sp. 1MA-6-2]|uniref:carboxypeptidase-like regulatory domain-containing protein n=1 Tax=Antarcticibacterium sp. 1MA-6-2 TaxID=2908210 RepID=UPI001F2F26E4|nr:carboxypeptidase-like regulatory domain-containing protein [Antarcticibacterium sp. 1MA-6-2]UJH90130.1 carboxypeptidase-like regulatory domain-containing protein [Antarcticibacterium sp. 1MA-6-2]